MHTDSLGILDTCPHRHTQEWALVAMWLIDNILERIIASCSQQPNICEDRRITRGRIASPKGAQKPRARAPTHTPTYVNINTYMDTSMLA